MERKIFETEHEIFRDSVRRFLEAEIKPAVPGWLEAGIVDRDAFRKAGEHGLCLMWADEEDGGIGVEDFRYEQIVIDVYKRVSPGVVFIENVDNDDPEGGGSGSRRMG